MSTDAETGIGARPDGRPGRLDHGVVAVATVSSAVFCVMLLGAGIAGPDRSTILKALGPLVVAVVGGWQLYRRRPRPLAHLGIGTLALAFNVWQFGPEPSSVMGLLAMALVGVLFVRRYVLLYVAGATVTLMAASVLWVPADRPPLQRLAEGSGRTVLFVFTASLVHWMRLELEAGRARYRDLFHRAQVPMWEVDYSAVGAWLDRRRVEGVTDLRAYLRDRPGALAELGSLACVLEVNAAAVEFIGARSRESALGRVEVERLPDGLAGAFLAQIDALWAGEPVVEAELSLTRRDGSVVDGALTASAQVRDGKLELSHVVTSVTDVTEPNRNQRRLEELVRAKDDFVAAISHEVRTPLTAVVGLADELVNRYDEFDRADVQEMVAVIADQSLEVAHIVEDLLVAARTDVGSLVLDCAVIDLPREVLAVAAGLASDVAVEVDLRAEAPLTWADPGRVRQVLRNLLVNAERHGGGSIRIRTRFTDTHGFVEVCDAGPPIPAAERDAIFDRYVSAPRTTGLTASVGLGLTVSRELARLMAGDVLYAHDGSESVFALALPNAGDGQRVTAAALLAAGV